MKSIEMLKGTLENIIEKALEIEDVLLKLIESVPGVGELSSRVLLNEINKVERFDNS